MLSLSGIGIFLLTLGFAVLCISLYIKRSGKSRMRLTRVMDVVGGIMGVGGILFILMLILAICLLRRYYANF